MTNSKQKNRQPGKPTAESSKVLKILSEARQVVDDLGRGAAMSNPPRKKEPATPGKASPRSRPKAGETKKSAARKKTPAAKKTTSPRKPPPSPVKATATARVTPKPPSALPPPPRRSPQEFGIRVVHALPGRVRFRLHSLKFNPDFAQEVETKLAAIPGITEAEASPSTGSLLISYRSKELVESPLREALETWFPGLDTDSLLDEIPA